MISPVLPDNYLPFTIYDLLAFSKYFRRFADIASRGRDYRLGVDVNLLAFLNRALDVVFADEINRLIAIG